MSLQSALFTGVSGLNTYSSIISIIGNNIANVNTPGFKESRASFSDILRQSLTPSRSFEVGRGVYMHGVNTLFTQGSLQSTTLASDLAITGEGFFIVNDPQTSATLYTRTGNFTLNRNGDLVNSQGMILQGFNLDAEGNPIPGLTNLNINGTTFPPKMTEKAQISANLNADTKVLEAPFNPAAPDNTYNFSTSIPVYDSLGNQHSIEVYFRKVSDNTWEWFLTAHGDELEGIDGSDLKIVSQGRMTFTEQGTLDTIVTTDRLNYDTGEIDPLDPIEQGASAIFTFAGGAQADQAVTFNFGTPRQVLDDPDADPPTFKLNPEVGNDSRGTTQYADSPSAILLLSQNGYASGVLQSFSINEQGTVRGLFSNGQTMDLMQVALAKFPSNSGLSLVGMNLFSHTQLSGDPVVSSPGTSGMGLIVSNALEISNVDLSAQFVELIRAQQAFQANARVITTGDALLTEVVNLRR